MSSISELSLSQASGVPYYRQLEDQIAALIRSGRLPAGERLPSVRELTGQVLVSLITVRKAYERLEGAGLIVRLQGRGTFVTEQVVEVARAHAHQPGVRIIEEAVTRARQLGLDERQIRAAMADALNGEQT